MAAFQICFAPVISWALTFQGVPFPYGPSTKTPYVSRCYQEKFNCDDAADAANVAFLLEGHYDKHKAVCVAQPPSGNSRMIYP